MNITTQFFADRLSRERALTADETDVLTSAMVRTGQRRIWTAADDRELKRLRRTLDAPRIAEQMGRTVWAVRSRVRALKRMG